MEVRDMLNDPYCLRQLELGVITLIELDAIKSGKINYGKTENWHFLFDIQNRQKQGVKQGLRTWDDVV